MRTLFISDALFTRHEREMIERLAVGLADEGVRVAWGVPDGRTLGEQVLLPVIEFLPRRLGLTPARRGAALLERATEVLGGPPEIVHQFGGGAARLGAEVTRAARAVPAFEVWRPGTESSIRGVINRVYAGDREMNGTPRALIVTADDDMRERLMRQFPAAVVRTIPWGVYSHRGEDAPRASAPSLMLLGPGRDQKSWSSAFQACVRAIKSSPDALMFADAEATRKLKLWSHARAAGVLDRLTLIDEAETQRELVLSCGIVLNPDARGEQRTILLDAMASGVMVVASADPRSRDLIDGKTARLVVDSSESQWHEAIEMVTHDHAYRRRVTESARAYVREHHKASRQIASLVDAYEWVAGEGERIETVPALGPEG